MNLKTKLQTELTETQPTLRNFGSRDFSQSGLEQSSRNSWVKSALILGYILVVLLISGLARANGL